MKISAIDFWSVKTFRAVGLEAKWSKTKNGRPCIVLRNPKSPQKHQRETWWILCGSMVETMKNVGIVAGFDQSTLLGNLFSI